MGLLTPLDTMVRCPGQLVYQATVTCFRVRQIIVTIYMKGLQSTLWSMFYFLFWQLLLWVPTLTIDGNLRYPQEYSEMKWYKDILNWSNTFRVDTENFPKWEWDPQALLSVKSFLPLGRSVFEFDSNSQPATYSFNKIIFFSVYLSFQQLSLFFASQTINWKVTQFFRQYICWQSLYDMYDVAMLIRYNSYKFSVFLS